jgi:hypothetical protein
MGKLPQGTTCATMDALAGRLKNVLDFYFWKGIPCVRAWPKGAEVVRSEARAASASAFAAIAQQKTLLPANIKENLKLMSAGSTYTWGDLWTKNQLAIYKATGEIAPLPTELIVTTGSGLSEIDVTFNGPCSPALVPFRNLKPVPGVKYYRGAAERCDPPHPPDPGPIYPVPLRVEQEIVLPLTRVGELRYGNAYIPDYPNCRAAAHAAVTAYNGGSPLTPYTPGIGFVFRIDTDPYHWWVRVLGQLTYFSGLFPSGISPFVNPGALRIRMPTYVVGNVVTYTFVIKINGVNWVRYIPQTTSSVDWYFPLTALAGDILYLHIYPEDYYHQYDHDVCEQSGISHIITANCGTPLISACYGVRWRWRREYVPPFPDDCYVGIVAKNGEFYPLFPATVGPRV